MKSIIAILISASFLTAESSAQDNAGTSKSTTTSPNIVVILTDDQGYADISFNTHHPAEVATPHMDSLAKEGVFFTNAYTSGHVCSPTRAGLMLGRYQQRVGVYTAGDGGRGFDPKLPIFPAFLPKEYTSTAIGKWHLGLDDDFPTLKWHAVNRGFDQCYFSLKGVNNNDYNPIYRNKTRLKDEDYEGYMTTRLTEEAVAFIDREKANPFFLYLAYNAVHAPAQAPKEDIARYQEKFPGLSNKRAILMAMLMPALSKAKRKAQVVVCMNNFRQIGGGAFNYWGDNDQTFPGPMSHWTIFWNSGNTTNIRENLIDICSGVPEKLLHCPFSNPELWPENSWVPVGADNNTKYADKFHVQGAAQNYRHTSSTTILLFMLKEDYCTGTDGWKDQPNNDAPRTIPVESDSVIACENPSKGWDSTVPEALHEPGSLLWGDGHVSGPRREFRFVAENCSFTGGPYYFRY